MAWVTPKTDWKLQPVDSLGRYNGDWFRVADYERIKGNLEYLNERISAIFTTTAFISMPGQSVSDYPYYDRLNNIERNIDILKTALPFSPSLPATRTWYDMDVAPTVYDINRWESCCLTLYNALSAQSASAIVWRIPFHMNGRRF